MSTLIARMTEAAGKQIVSVEQDETSVTIRDADGEELSLRLQDHNGMQSVIEAVGQHWGAQ